MCWLGKGKMTIWVAVVLLAAVLGVGLIYGLRRSRESSGSPRTLEEKLAVLKECGFDLAPEFTKDDLLKVLDRADYEKEGWDTVLDILGMHEMDEPFRHYCRNLWTLDTECIEDHGDYVRIARRMVDMSQGSLVLDDIRDHVDIDAGEAWLSFRFKGREIRFDCQVQDDWVDDRVFSVFDRLMDESDPNKAFVYRSLPGQECLIGCVSHAQLRKLRQHGLLFEKGSG